MRWWLYCSETMNALGSWHWGIHLASVDPWRQSVSCLKMSLMNRKKTLNQAPCLIRNIITHPIEYFSTHSLVGSICSPAQLRPQRCCWRWWRRWSWPRDGCQDGPFEARPNKGKSFLFPRSLMSFDLMVLCLLLLSGKGVQLQDGKSQSLLSTLCVGQSGADSLWEPQQELRRYIYIYLLSFHF